MTVHRGRAAVEVKIPYTLVYINNSESVLITNEFFPFRVMRMRYDFPYQLVNFHYQVKSEPEQTSN